MYVYGEAGLKKDHPVLDFLSKGHCKAVKYLRDGFAAFEAAYPFLVTTSVKANAIKNYPSQVCTVLQCA